MFPWMIAGSVVLVIIVVLVLRDAIADDRRRKLSKPKNYTNY